jgi:hypothetical protein
MNTYDYREKYTLCGAGEDQDMCAGFSDNGDPRDNRCAHFNEEDYGAGCSWDGEVKDV